MHPPSLADIQASIIRAAVDPEAWQGVMDALAAAHPGTKPGLVGRDAAMRRNRPGVHANIEDSFAESYAAHYGRCSDGMERWAALEAGRVAHTFEIIPEADLLRSELYNGWLKPQGDLRHAAMTVLSRDPGRFFLFTYQIELRAAATSLDSVFRTLRAVAPLMSHALDVNRMLLGLRLDATILRHGLEPDGIAIVLLAHSGAVLHANAQAERMLAAGRTVRIDGRGRLA